MQEKSITINEEDAFNFIVRILHEGLKIIRYSNYGYDLYLPNVMQEYLITVQGIELQNIKDNEAYTSLALLLRFAQFANER